MDRIHHIALPVSHIARAVAWYQAHFDCTVSYQDDTWAMLTFANIQLALVLPEQHPQHIAFMRDDAANFGKLITHRDGTASVYIKDSEGNSVEILDTKK